MYNLLMIIFFFQAEDGIRDYKVTGVQTCALPIFRPLAPAEPRPAPLAGPVDRVDAGHPDPEDGLDRLPDLGLAGTWRDDEGVLAVIRQPVALLGDDRLEQVVPRVGDLAHEGSSGWRGGGGGAGESVSS